MNDKEKSIAWSMQYCQHYDANALFMVGGVEATGCCKAGVKMRETWGSRPGIWQRIPCGKGKADGSNNTELQASCSKWLQVTREQGEARYNDIQAMIDRMRKVGPVVAAWRTWRSDNRVSKQEVIDCAACNGKNTLHLSQAAYNGHVWGKCTTEGCVSWME